MNQDTEPVGKGNFKSRRRILAVVSLCVLVLANVLYWLLVSPPARPSPTSPPDLSRCTRIRIVCHSSLSGDEDGLLTLAEVNDLKSWKEIIIEDKATIKAMAKAVKRGSFVSGPGTRIAMKPPYDVVGYRGDQTVVSIPVYGPFDIVTSEGYLFNYGKGQLFDPLVCAPKIRALVWRRECADYIILL